MNNCKKIVITGASGFLGSNLVKRLKNDKKIEVYAFTSRPDELKESIGGANLHYYHKDSLAEKKDCLKESIVVNCAFPRNLSGEGMAEGLKYIQNLFETSVEYNADAIINISSQSVYSQHRKEAATEDTELELTDVYALGKYTTELMLESICKRTDVCYTNLRLASLIGPGFNQRIVNRIVIGLVHNESIRILRQKKTLGFLDIEDAIDAILSLMHYPNHLWKDIYNVGSGKGYTVEEIYEAVATALDNQIKSSNVVFDEGFEEDSSVVAFERLRVDTGFKPQIKLSESIKRIINDLALHETEEGGTDF